ncbi:MAG: hypothetical protein A4E40_00362 [Methanoregulaceae archaeon PtaU1.Bin059]|nr:MAG: hypothetical protein A4E40_00362 [Methanoregulaceae archaeon PtaU1.Bin059]
MPGASATLSFGYWTMMSGTPLDILDFYTQYFCVFALAINMFRLSEMMPVSQDADVYPS